MSLLLSHLLGLLCKAGRVKPTRGVLFLWSPAVLCYLWTQTQTPSFTPASSQPLASESHTCISTLTSLPCLSPCHALLRESPGNLCAPGDALEKVCFPRTWQTQSLSNSLSIFPFLFMLSLLACQPLLIWINVSPQPLIGNKGKDTVWAFTPAAISPY